MLERKQRKPTNNNESVKCSFLEKFSKHKLNLMKASKLTKIITIFFQYNIGKDPRYKIENHDFLEYVKLLQMV